MNDWDYTAAKLEREAIKSSGGDRTTLTSIAISLKRIADTLEKVEAKMPYVQTIIGPAIGAAGPAWTPRCTCGDNWGGTAKPVCPVHVDAR